MRARRGKSLIEMMILMAVLSSTMTMVGGMMASMMRAESSQDDARRRTAGVSRLAARFRGDAHAAERAELEDAASSTTITFVLRSGETVTYALEDRITRTVRRGGEERAAFDSWPIDAEQARLELSDNGRRAVLECLLVTERTTPAESASPSGGRTARIEAAVGFDNRFSEGASE